MAAKLFSGQHTVTYHLREVFSGSLSHGGISSLPRSAEPERVGVISGWLR
jgi:hypothetical protein